MTITNQQMVAFFTSCEEILKLRIPHKVYTAVALNVDNMQSAASIYDKQRLELVKKYCKLDDHGEPVVESGNYVIENTTAYEADLTELLMVDVDITVQTIPESVLDNMDLLEKYDSLTGQQYRAISFMIE